MGLQSMYHHHKTALFYAPHAPCVIGKQGQGEALVNLVIGLNFPSALTQ